MEPIEPTPQPGRVSRLGWLLDHPLAALWLLLACFALFVAGLIWTKPPWVDEGWFASPGVNLARQGCSGTSILESAGTPYLRLAEHTYWQPPLHFVLQSAWYQCVGFGLGAMRALSLAWAVVALAALYLLAATMSGSRQLALLAVALCASNFIFLQTAADGRMDMMCAALALCGLASYVMLRREHFSAAVLVSHSLIVLGGLTHPHGILGWFALLILALGYDAGRLRMRHAALALAPYLIGAAAWGAYIAADPEAFLAQFGGNIAGRARAESTWAAILWSEIKLRYLYAFGFDPQANSLARLKAPLLIMYALTCGYVLLRTSLRSQTYVRCLLAMLAADVLFLAFLQGNKAGHYYLLYPLPIICLLMAASALDVRNSSWRRWVAPALCCVLVLGLIGPANSLRKNGYRNEYAPMIQSVRAAAGTADPGSGSDAAVFGSAELAFELGFDGQVIDDVRLGFEKPATARAIVLDARYRQCIDDLRHRNPAAHDHVQRTLASRRVAFENGRYTVYGPPAAAARGQVGRQKEADLPQAALRQDSERR